MKKNIFKLFIAGLMIGGLARQPVMLNTKAATVDTEVNAVSTQNIAGGYGLGISVTFNPALHHGLYWVNPNETIKDGLKLYNPYNEALTNEDLLVEFVGNELAINRNSPLGTNYYGYIMTFAEGLEIEGEGSTSKLSAAASFISKDKEGKVGYYWERFVAPTSLSLDESSKEVEIGKTYTLIPTIVSDDPNPVLSYRTADSSVATIDSNGVVTPVSEGTTTAFVYSGLLQASMTIEVIPASVSQTGIKITTPDKKITTYQGVKWDLTQLKAVKLYGEDVGAEIEITPEMISGTVDLETLGLYTLTLTADGFTDTFVVEVVDVPETHMLGLLSGNHFGNNSGWGSQFYFVTTVPDTSHYLNLDETTLANINASIKINGQFDKVNSVKNLGGGRYELWFKDPTLKAGDTIELLPGLKIWQYSGTIDGNHNPNNDGDYVPVAQFKASVKFVYTGHDWQVYVGEPTDFTLILENNFVAIGQEIQIEYTVTPDETYGTPTYTTSNADVATVSATGKVVGVGEGDVTITATLGVVEHSVLITVIAAKEIARVELLNVYNYYSVVKDSDATDFKPNLTTARFVFEDDTFSPEISISEDDYVVGSVDTSIVGDFKVPVTLTINEVSYETTINIKVYEYYDQEVKEVAVVDWFIYATFIQFTNTSTNRGNITSGPELEEILSKISYERADGTKVNLKGVYQLGENIVIFPEFLYDDDQGLALNENNYNEYYLEGDTITLAENLPVYKWTGNLQDTGSDNNALVPGTGEVIIEGFVTQTLQFKYLNNIWVSWIEYEDIYLASSEITLEVNETKSAGASRLPTNATQGQFTYESSNPQVATVSGNGVIKGISEGTATITVTLSDKDDPSKTKTATIAITVTDPVKYIEFSEGLTVKQGTLELDLSQVEAHFVHASGKKGDVVDLKDAIVDGYDATILGEQTVTVSVTIGDVVYSGVITINVVAGGITPLGLGLAIGAPVVVIGALGLVIAIRKRKIA